MNERSEGTEMTDADLQVRLRSHMDACRRQIPQFIAANYSVPGAIRLSRLAWGTDVWIAPFNVFLGLPNFVLQLLAIVADLIRARRVAGQLRRRHLAFPTHVQETLRFRLMSDVLGLGAEADEAVGDPLKRAVARAAQEPVLIYLHTRNVAADITAGTFAGVAGLAFLSQFTPGSISAGSAFAQTIALEQAVSGFWLGDSLGRLYYTMFPVDPSPTIVGVSLVAVMGILAIVSAFSGIIHDPVQRITGIHSRRLNKLLDAIEESIDQSSTKGYRPKDTFLGRVYDVVDWIKALVNF